MSNRTIQTIWFDIKFKNGRRFQFPVVLNIFRELMDCALDLTTLACLCTPKASSLHPLTHATGDLIEMLLKLTGELTKDRPYNLMDVSADDVKVMLKVK